MERLPLMQAAGGARGLLVRALPRAALFGVLWAILTGGTPASWLLGAPIVILSSVAAVALNPAGRWRVSPSGLAAFVPYFVWRSARGGVDVALRAMHPALPIAPSLETHRLSLPIEGPARVFLADVLSLLPGTLCAELRGDEISVHVLSGGSPAAREELRRLELKIAALFGVPLSTPPDPPGDLG
jgi:multicomponent Na+:H+ antiporter subunit E